EARSRRREEADSLDGNAPQNPSPHVGGYHGEMRVESIEAPSQQIFDVAVEPGGAFWLATSDGLFRHAAPLWNASADKEPFQPQPPEHSAISFTARNGDVWLSDQRGVTRFQNEKQQTFPRS